MAQAPETLAVYYVAAIDTLDALGIVPAGVPGNLYVDYLDDVVGRLFEPDFEAINALAPDLVIIGGRSSEQLEPMARLAPTDMTI